MNRWFGSSQDSDRQASERNRRAARRTIASLQNIASDSDDEFGDANQSLSNLNLDGEPGDDPDMADAEQRRLAAEAELTRQRGLAVEDADFQNDPDSWKKEIRVKFDQNDVKYFFNTVESQMRKHGINRQWDKKDALVETLPDHIIEECKPILRLTKDEAGDQVYKDLKNEILGLYGPKDEDAFKQAIALKIGSGSPSAFGKKLIHYICPGAKPFNNCHCARIVFGFWQAQLSPPIKSSFAGQVFNKDTYQNIFKLADQVWLANGGSIQTPAVVAAIAPPSHSPPPPSSDNGQGQTVPQVAAFTRGGGRGRGSRGNRGNNRGSGRGGRGGQSSSSSSTNTNQNQSNNQKSHQKGDKHPDLPAKADWACAQHWRKGRGAPYCSGPLVCQWVNIVAPRQ